MERPVGDKFKINGCVYVVVSDDARPGYFPCDVCAFSGVLCADYLDVRGRCDKNLRVDRTSVHFEHFGVDF